MDEVQGPLQLWAYPDTYPQDREAILDAYRNGRIRVVVADTTPQPPCGMCTRWGIDWCRTHGGDAGAQRSSQ